MHSPPAIVSTLKRALRERAPILIIAVSKKLAEMFAAINNGDHQVQLQSTNKPHSRSLRHGVAGMLIGVSSLAMCATASAALPTGVVAEVNGTPITQAQVDNAVRTSGQADSSALRQALINELIARQLLAQRALKANYDRRPEVQAALERARTIVLAEAWAHDNAHPAPVTDADVRAAYDRIISSLGKTEYKPSAIVMTDAGSAQRAAQALAQGAEFAQVARQYSRGPTAVQGGALPWVSFKLPVQAGHTQNWPTPLAQALAALPRGGYTKTPVQVGNNYYLIRKDDERPTQIPAFDTSKAAVRQQLEASAVQAANAAMIGQLTKDATIQR